MVTERSYCNVDAKERAIKTQGIFGTKQTLVNTISINKQLIKYC